MAVMFHEGLVGLSLPAEDWKEAVRQAGRLLVDAGAVTPAYIDAMIRMVEEVGAYIVVAPGVAMPHARPEEGARQVAVAVVRLKSPVAFPGKAENPVDLLFAFSGTDDTSHLDLIRGLAGLLRDAANMARLRTVESAAEVTRLFGPLLTGKEG